MKVGEWYQVKPTVSLQTVLENNGYTEDSTGWHIAIKCKGIFKVVGLNSSIYGSDLEIWWPGALWTFPENRIYLASYFNLLPNPKVLDILYGLNENEIRRLHNR